MNNTTGGLWIVVCFIAFNYRWRTTLHELARAIKVLLKSINIEENTEDDHDKNTVTNEKYIQ